MSISVEEWELVHFFEVLPVTLEENIGWPNNDFAFEVQQGDLIFSFAIYPTYKDVRLILKHQEKIVYEFNAMNVVDVRMGLEKQQPFLEIVLPAEQKLLICLKPTLQIKHTYSAT